jgi:hypothetical protein
MTRVLQLTDPRASDVRLSGLRMATLARLAAAGIEVPPGFVVTTECGEWADPEAEGAVYRGYDDLGDGRGGLPIVYAETSPASEDTAPPPGGTFEPQRGISTLAELFTAIDACRGSARHEQGRPYYPGPPATFTAVGVLQALPAEVSGVSTTRDAPEPVRDTVARVGEVLGADVSVEWAVIDGRVVVLQARALHGASQPVA